MCVKLSFGESGNPNHLAPALIAPLVQGLNATLVECNTAYQSSRRHSSDHMKTAEEHDFTTIAPIDIMDNDGETALPVTDGKHLNLAYIGKNWLDYDFTIVLSHFKGHPSGGFGGALKNMAIGMQSSNGKAWVHTTGKNHNADNWWTDRACVDAVHNSPDHGKVHMEQRIAERNGTHLLDYAEELGLGTQKYVLIIIA